MPPATNAGLNWRQVRRWIRIVWVSGGLAFMAWMSWNFQAHGVSKELTRSARDVRVIVSDDATVFLASGPPDRAALVFLPGGGVDPRAYVPPVRAVAAAGYSAAIVFLPYRMAWTEEARELVWQRVQTVQGLWGQDRPVVLAGHSRGAAIAAWLAARHAGDLDGLALLGTTHPREDDLSRLTIPVLKVLAEHDCVAPPAQARANAARLPPSTRWVEIPGGNHAQFGYYGSQINDCRATIPRDEQQRLVVSELVAELAQARRAAN